MKRIDLSGQTFGTWTAIQRVRGPKRSAWLCKCSCGAERVMPPNQLTHATPHCKCSGITREAKDIAGKQIGFWTAIEFRRFRKQAQQQISVWLFRCICGTEREAAPVTLRKNSSCGCQRGAHRHTAPSLGGTSPTYRSWSNMIARCTQPSNPAFAYYKKRGITVCKRWRKFENFLADMGERPSPKHTLDRKENNGNYEPGNVRWATKQEQANNRITNVRLMYKGNAYTLAELARATGVSKELLRSRLLRCRRPWTVEGAVSTPPMVKGTNFSC